MPDLNWNKITWDTYNWPARGEEWSEPWGGSESQWFGSLFPRLHRFLPARRILEIAPGYGRWSEFLIPACDEFIGIDLSSRCVDACRERFSKAKHAQFFSNNGYSLEAAQNESCDLVFSFDSLVHAELDVLASYIPEVLRKLTASGVAFLHHSNLLACASTIDMSHRRAANVSADAVADLVTRNGGKLIIQEVINWRGKSLIDCFSLFSRANGKRTAKSIRLENPLFMSEAALIKNFQSYYSALSFES